ncbi:hypothetical protein [Arthrobacter sp. UYEF3]|uniref:hypothetical protein n=1 Tax=Arthrobacter sp. UYEF3 TaxID=1756365 RepID=UPI003396D1A7
MGRAPQKKEADFRFRKGDRVKGSDRRGICFQGIVELIAKKQRILWIQTPAGERKLIDSTEHSIERCS